MAWEAAPGLVALVLVVVLYNKTRRLEKMIEDIYVSIERKMPPE
jgi:hypothetical protein